MGIQSQIDSDIKDAMRAKDAGKLSLLRMLKSAIKYAAIESGAADGALDDAEVVAVIRKEVKKRQDSIESFTKGGRPELSDKERDEITLLSAYLPPALEGEALAALVAEAIAEAGATSRKEMGAAMKIANAKAAGRADGRALSAEVQRQLA